jgi:hypothetical protein
VVETDKPWISKAKVKIIPIWLYDFQQFITTNTFLQSSKLNFLLSSLGMFMAVHSSKRTKSLAWGVDFSSWQSAFPHRTLNIEILD